jgi:glycosyltransferase involved in cell wall biosynthesis
MRVIHTVGGIAERLGGPSRTVTSLCSSIGRLDGSVDLVAGVDRSSNDRLIRPDANCVNLRLVDGRRFGRIQFYPGVLRTLTRMLDEQAQPTLIHDHGVWGHTNVAAWQAARSRGVPYVLSPRGMLEPWALEFKARKKKFAWLLYQQRIVASAAAVVATSEQECENVKRLFPKLPVAIIPNGVDLPVAADVSSARTPDLSGGTVLFMSRIHPKKNLTGLLHAWKLLTPGVNSGWRLVIAGPDEAGHGQEVAALVRELGLQDSVGLIGSVGEDSKAAVYQSADVFVLPSFSENFGVVVAEALAYGLPVIATTGTPWQELPRRGCGWWVGPDPESLAGALAQAMGRTFEERRAMGAVGRTYAQQQFSWDGIGASTMVLYEWLLSGRASQPDFVY